MSIGHAIRTLTDEIRGIDRNLANLRAARQQKATALSRLQAKEALTSARQPATATASR